MEKYIMTVYLELKVNWELYFHLSPMINIS